MDTDHSCPRPSWRYWRLLLVQPTPWWLRRELRQPFSTRFAPYNSVKTTQLDAYNSEAVESTLIRCGRSAACRLSPIRRWCSFSDAAKTRRRSDARLWINLTRAVRLITWPRFDHLPPSPGTGHVGRRPLWLTPPDLPVPDPLRPWPSGRRDTGAAYFNLRLEYSGTYYGTFINLFRVIN